MTHVYGISKGPEFGDILHSIESLEAFARNHRPGRYDVDEHSLDPFPGTTVSARAGGQGDPSQRRPGRRRPDSLASMSGLPNIRETDTISGPAHFTNAGTKGKLRYGQFPFAIGVLESPGNHEQIRMAFENGRTDDGLVVWRLSVRGADVLVWWVNLDGWCVVGEGGMDRDRSGLAIPVGQTPTVSGFRASRGTRPKAARVGRDDQRGADAGRAHIAVPAPIGFA
jgi:hypothetical protein